MRVLMGKKKYPVFSGGELTFQNAKSAILDFVPVIRFRRDFFIARRAASNFYRESNVQWR